MTAVKTNYPIVGLVFLIFFVISFITNILGPLIPDIIKSFTLSLGMAGFLPFSFFVAYAVSIPSGMVLERYGEKRVIGGAFLLAFAGSLAFAMQPDFRTAPASLFVIGAGMATLQVAINPLLRVAGGDAHFAFYSVMAQLVFGLASWISPKVFSYLVGELTGYAGGGNPLVASLARVSPPELPWISLYWVFAVVSVLMVAVVAVAPLPRVELKEDERTGVMSTYASLLRERYVWLYALAIFCYVGMEQGTANWISQFLQTYHGFDPQTTGATAVGRFWLLMTLGCLLGLVLLKLMDSRYVLMGAAIGAMLSLTAALYGSANVALTAFPAVGFCASVMWSIIFSLALNSAREHHGSFSGILCTAVVGGAVAPFVVGWLGDLAGLRQGMLLLYVPLAYILSVGMWARPLVTNATIAFGKKESARL